MNWHNATMCSPNLILIFFFNDTATTEIYTLSLHDALPISPRERTAWPSGLPRRRTGPTRWWASSRSRTSSSRSEEHTSELQSHLNVVCRLLLEKKNEFAKCYNVLP